MAVEIERKFIVASPTWRDDAGPGRIIRQGYLAQADATVRVRRIGERAVLTVKGPRKGFTRAEFEYPIPVSDAEEMLTTLCQGSVLEKVRHDVRYGGHIWHVDVFSGVNAGLVLADIELAAPDEVFPRPPWIGAEVTGNPNFGHDVLIRRRAGEVQIESERSVSAH